jgi:crotonyl-CoA carboxylase/reductase
MYENRHPHGNMAILIGAREEGLGIREPVSAGARARGQTASAEPEEVYVPPRDVREAAPGPVIDDVLVGEICHEGVICCSLRTTVRELAETMEAENITAVVVVREEDGAALGVVSQTDLVLARQGRSAEELTRLPASAVMTPELVSCERGTSVCDAITTMTRHGIHRLVVVEREGGVTIPVGVVSMTDVIQKLIGRIP